MWGKREKKQEKFLYFSCGKHWFLERETYGFHGGNVGLLQGKHRRYNAVLGLVSRDFPLDLKEDLKAFVE